MIKQQKYVSSKKYKKFGEEKSYKALIDHKKQELKESAEKYFDELI